MAAKAKDDKASKEPIERLTATLAFDEPVERVRLISPARARALSRLGVHRVRDLVAHFPRRYIDLSSVETVQSACIGQQCTIQGIIHEMRLKKPRRNLTLVEVSLVDDTGILMITAFRQPWLMDQLKAGMRVAVAGKLEFDYGYKRMTNPFIEIVSSEGAEFESGLGAGRIIPVHPATEKISTAWMRRLVENSLDMIDGCYDPMPVELRLKYRLMAKGAALRCIHFPQSMQEMEQARRRLAYEELLLLELFLMREGSQRSQGRRPVRHRADGPRVAAFAAALPFSLTDEQQRACEEMLSVMGKGSVANHLILGDVGTGKTVVAGFGLAAAADSQGQALLMAPTEVLARQHMKSLGALLQKAGVSCALLTGSTPAEERASILEALAKGSLQVLVGTHALLEDDVVARNLTLCVIDEQQRFGVEQRARLLSKGEAPDAVYLTATPIPRSMALALFGNLTLSYIKQRPNDLAHRETFVVAKDDRGQAYDAIREALNRGEQAYVVCPLIGKSADERDAKAQGGAADAQGDEDYHPAVSIEDDADLLDDNVSAATREAQMLQGMFVDHQVELLHGKLPSAQKEEVMERFRSGQIDVLVATTVIEVGVDVANATVMVIEDADRFGLSQLHQLRGRVGRGQKSAKVYLVSASRQEAALARLRALETTDDGFELAAFDLSLRREGDILGNRQHGASALKLVNIMRDGNMIEAAHGDAAAILDLDPLLEEPEHRPLAREMRILFERKQSVQGG